ncbi:BLOC-1-related complex subunit 6-like isoform X2 [Liolophura sinensis]
MTEVTDSLENSLVNGNSDKQPHTGVSSGSITDKSKNTDEHTSAILHVNGEQSCSASVPPVKSRPDIAPSTTKSRLKEIDKDKSQASMGCNNTRTVMVIEPTKKTSGKVSPRVTESEHTDNNTKESLNPSKNSGEIEASSKTGSSDNVFADQIVQDTMPITNSSDSGQNRSRNTSRTSESTNSDTEKAALPSESASESTEKVVRETNSSSDVTDIEETAYDGNQESSSLESGSQNRPHSLSLPKPLQYYERHRHKGLKAGIPDDTSSDDQISVDSDISSLGSSLQGMIMRKGDMIEFVADNLQEKIRGSRDSSSMGSRTSSMRSISSVNSISSYTSSLATSVSGMSRSPSSLVQQSPDAIPPIDPQAMQDLESQARVVADRVDLMMGNLKANLFKMSAITVGTLDAYKHSVESTCEAVDASIKAMYALMAKCEELSTTVKPVYQLADQIKEIKRLLDLFEGQLDTKT